MSKEAFLGELQKHLEILEDDYLKRAWTAEYILSGDPQLASDEELASFPDSLVISAGKDSLQQETESFAHRLMSLGVPVTGCRIPEAVHGFTTNRTEGWEKALALHCKFFQSHYNRL